MEALFIILGLLALCASVAFLTVAIAFVCMDWFTS